MADHAPVLQVLGPSTGGIRRHVAHLSDALRRRGWPVRIAGPTGVLDGLAALDHVVEVPHRASAVRGWAARRALQAVVGDVALVHAHGLKAGWVAASLRRRPPLVVTVHNLVLSEVAGPAAWPLQRLEGLLPRFADRTLATSAEVARRFTGTAGAGRVSVVPPAWPAPAALRSPGAVRAELGVAGDDLLLVTVARLHPQKGLDVLLDAVALLRQRRLGVRCVVVGEGPLEGWLRRRIQALDLVERVVLTGARADVADVLAAADVVVIPSRWESGPLVLFEALWLERPVVSTCAGVAPDVMGDGVGGRVVPVDDAFALARAAEEVGRDPVRAAACAAAGRRRVTEGYGDDVLIGAVEAMYHDVLELGPRPQGSA